MSVLNLFMYKKEHYTKIVSYIKERPMSQNEIHKKLGSEISVQGIAKDLTRAVSLGVITFLGNKVNKKDAKWLLREYYHIKWPTNAWQCYIPTPKTEKFYRCLKRMKVKDTEKILQLYCCLEVSAINQSLCYENLNVLRKDFKSRGQNLTNLELKKKIARKRREVKEFYNCRDKKDLTLKLLRLTPLMYWCAFHRPVQENHPEYDTNKDIIKLLTSPLLDKLKKSKIENYKY